MRRWGLIIGWLAALWGAGLAPAWAADEPAAELLTTRSDVITSADEPYTGYVFSVGPILGVETNAIEQFGAGITSYIGFLFQEKYGFFFTSDWFMTKKSGTTIQFVDFLLEGDIFLVKRLFFSAAFGGTLGNFNGPFNFASGPSTGSSTELGYEASGGLGYSFRIARNASIDPEIEFNFRRLRGTNFMTPQLKITLSFGL